MRNKGQWHLLGHIHRTKDHSSDSEGHTKKQEQNKTKESKQVPCSIY